MIPADVMHHSFLKSMSVYSWWSLSKFEQFVDSCVMNFLATCALLAWSPRLVKAVPICASCWTGYNIRNSDTTVFQILPYSSSMRLYLHAKGTENSFIHLKLPRCDEYLDAMLFICCTVVNSPLAGQGITAMQEKCSINLIFNKK